jgi:hypothetical protein
VVVRVEDLRVLGEQAPELPVVALEQLARARKRFLHEASVY